MEDEKEIVLDKQKRIDFIMMQWHKYFAPTRNWTDEERAQLQEINRTVVEKLHAAESKDYAEVVNTITREQLSPLIQKVIERIIKSLGPEFEDKVVKEGVGMTEEEFRQKFKEIVHRNLIDMVFLKADRKVVATKLKDGGFAFAWDSDKDVQDEKK